MLEVRNLSAGYGPITVIRDISLDVNDGEIYALLGANGAGKTTLVNAIMGFVKCRKGSVKLDNVDVTGLSLDAHARMGMSIVPEGRRLFSELTVAENLRLGGYNLKGTKFEEQLDFVHRLFPVLRDLRNSPSPRLSGGQQQMLAIARALIPAPRFVVLDEPLTGLMPQAVEQVLKTITMLKENGMSILLVEQNLRKAVSVADRMSLMQNGRLILESKADAAIENEIVKAAYLG